MVLEAESVQDTLDDRRVPSVEFCRRDPSAMMFSVAERYSADSGFINPI